MVTNLALVQMRRDMFKEQTALTVWKKYYQYRTIITTAGIINIRNNNVKALWVAYAFMNDTTQFSFISCFMSWANFAKVILNNFIFYKTIYNNNYIKNI